MSLTTSLAAQSAILRQNQAEMAMIRANQAQQNLALNGRDINSVSRKEAQLEAEKLRTQTTSKVSRAQRNALKNAKSKKNKLDIYA